MHMLFKPAAIVLISATIFSIPKPIIKDNQSPSIITVPGNQSKIQVAILLDVSNSMDGLIEQAKAQLWNMVSVLGKTKCNGTTPAIEIALYEYGRSSNNVKEGYVKQVSGFTTDLDELSKRLFNLTTNGGDEYCGHVIYSSINELKWDNAASNYKVIFIAGNEDFLQGDIIYTKACNAAKNKGVIVNTIYCGDKAQGIQEHWNLSAECGNGSFTNINQDAKIDDIATPQDSILFSLNEKLNSTYIAYGYDGNANFAKQEQVDKINYKTNKSSAAKRAAVKSEKGLYNNANWDLVDAFERDSTAVAKVDTKTLQGDLKNKNKEEIKQIVKEKTKERGLIQKQIIAVNNQREAYIAKVKATNAGSNAPTLETEVEKIIKEQAKRFNMVIE